MEELRRMQPGDITDCRRLWEACFSEDTAAFTDCFFRERYLPEYGYCLASGGKLVSAVYSLPMHILVRGKIIGASMLAGVSTFPEYRGRGYMKQVFARYMQGVYENGMPLAVHTPAHITTFFSRGHYPVSDTMHITYHAAPAADMPNNMLHTPLQAGAPICAALHACYQKAALRYSGIVSRSYADHAFKLRDYGADSAQCLLDRDDIGAVTGYAIYMRYGGRFVAEEVLCGGESGYDRLIQGLCAIAEGAPLAAKLPPDACVDAHRGAAEITPQGAAGAANIRLLLSALVGDPAVCFAVRDSVVPQNEGVWNGLGEACRRAPAVTLEAGRLVQFLIGYRSLSELAAEHNAVLHDRAAAEALDVQLPKQRCFIVDEY